MGQDVSLKSSVSMVKIHMNRFDFTLNYSPMCQDINYVRSWSDIKVSIFYHFLFFYSLECKTSGFSQRI